VGGEDLAGAGDQQRHLVADHTHVAGGGGRSSRPKGFSDELADQHPRPIFWHPQVQTYQTMTRSLGGMADRLRQLGVTRVVMEATSNYWKAPFTCWRPKGSRSG